MELVGISIYSESFIYFTIIAIYNCVLKSLVHLIFYFLAQLINVPIFLLSPDTCTILHNVSHESETNCNYQLWHEIKTL